MPPSDIQARVMQLISANRSPDSHVAGGLALNFDRHRLSHDIDIFHDPEARLGKIADEDAGVIQGAGMALDWKFRQETMHSAIVRQGDQVTEIDWTVDSAWRFFPAEPHPAMGWTLHPFDLATNKALAAAGRRAPRDAVDLVEIDRELYPLSIVAWAAVTKDPGFSPESLLMFIRRFARYQDYELESVPSERPLSARELSIGLREAIERAEAFAARMPGELAGLAFLQDGKIVEPDPDRLDRYETRAACRRGVWPIPSPADIQRS